MGKILFKRVSLNVGHESSCTLYYAMTLTPMGTGLGSIAISIFIASASVLHTSPWPVQS